MQSIEKHMKMSSAVAAPAMFAAAKISGIHNDFKNAGGRAPRRGNPGSNS